MNKIKEGINEVTQPRHSLAMHRPRRFCDQKIAVFEVSKLPIPVPHYGFLLIIHILSQIGMITLTYQKISWKRQYARACDQQIVKDKTECQLYSLSWLYPSFSFSLAINLKFFCKDQIYFSKGRLISSSWRIESSLWCFRLIFISSPRLLTGSGDICFDMDKSMINLIIHHCIDGEGRRALKWNPSTARKLLDKSLWRGASSTCTFLIEPS